ncbi:hypothetical protein MLD38_036248 [Melastoma candidum]|uniref:Uncharacterized protein n=1 Tax=Melastoma candidum TaxID=119954 RepID=A0ACB9LJT2_9MYRT|nr:hypothetical protein MLD38_036248 [Melastoma candidum]
MQLVHNLRFTPFTFCRRLSATPSLAARCCSSPPSPTIAAKPLFLRPPHHPSTLSDLRQWYSWAYLLSTSVGSSFLLSDGGPDSSLLLRELRWLLEDVLDTSSGIHPHLVTHPDDDSHRKVWLRAEIGDLYRLWRQRIEERKPFQYVVGCEHWRDLVLWVREGVLIPRPETEMIVDLARDAVGKNPFLRDGLWADLGTGSGAIAIGVSRLVLGDGGKVFATDLSPVALEVASYNVCRYGLEDAIELRKGSWFEPLRDVQGKLAGVVSNPPYIPTDDMLGLQAEVGRHEPGLALDGGVDGTDDLLHLCHGASSFLQPGGFFAFETNGEKHCQFLMEYLAREFKGSFRSVDVVSDFSGIPRFVIGFRC